MAAIIEASALVKTYGQTRALDQLEFSAESGRLTALLGPNGAGKTTLVSAVATLLKPDSGTLLVGGYNAVAEPRRVRGIIGLAGQSASVEQAMTGRENLVMVGRLFGLSKKQAAESAAKVLDQLALTDAADRLVRTYSGGMQRRLDLGASLVGRPRLLLLDEPTTGLDPRTRLELWSAIRDLVAGGTDVLLTTQYLEEADQLARDVVIIDHGRVIASGTPDELKSRAGRDVVEVKPRDPADIERVRAVLDGLNDATPTVDEETGRAIVGVSNSGDLAVAVRRLDDENIAVEDIGLRRPTLDEVFLRLTGQSASAATSEVADVH